MTKNILERKGDYFTYTSSSWSITEQSQDMSLEAGTEGEAVEEYCSLDCSPGLLSLPFFTIQDHLLRDDTANVGCALPH